MGKENGNQTGAAAPAAHQGMQTPAEAQTDIDNVTNALVRKHGVAPKETPPTAAQVAADKKAQETEAAASAAAEGKSETDEERAEREAAEAAGAGEGEETPEAKAEREAAEAAASDHGETDEEKAAATEKAETVKLIATKLKELPAEQRELVQVVIGERVGKVIAKERGARETAEAKATTAEARVTELEGELTEARKGGSAPAIVPGVHPLFLAKSATEIDARSDEIDQFIDWAEDHPEGWESPDETKYASWSADQIRTRIRELRREKDRILPQARTLLQTRATNDAALQKSFPALFKPGTEEHRAAQALRKLMPELGRHANDSTLIARLVLGDKALAALGQPPAKKPNEPVLPKKAPRAPGGGGPAREPNPDSSGKASVSSAVKKVMEDPTDPRARRAAFEALV